MPVFPWAEIDYRMQHPKKRRAKEEQWRSEEATAQKGARSDVVEVELLSLGQELQHTEVTVVFLQAKRKKELHKKVQGSRIETVVGGGLQS
mmetsp:Transcript_2052/g.4418  ORF Transcript_2052/g.4418 Transcript_2052/m.4418 type:complete len:91 (+) Transcript_2052:373-645(+)